MLPSARSVSAFPGCIDHAMPRGPPGSVSADSAGCETGQGLSALTFQSRSAAIIRITSRITAIVIRFRFANKGISLLARCLRRRRRRESRQLCCINYLAEKQRVDEQLFAAPPESAKQGCVGEADDQ